MEAVAAERTIGDYAIVETLGSGGQGFVKLGRHLSTGALVALKVINQARLAADARARVQLEREIEALRRAAPHENVIRLMDVYWDAIYPFRVGAPQAVVVLVLELAPSELFDFLFYTEKFPEHIARTYCQQLLAGLEHCHAQGVFHRDLKPDNLLMDDAFQLKIADFGMSAVTAGDEFVLLRTQCGTLMYMAPEVLARRPYEGAPADVWSAGVILFVMLAGVPPFENAVRGDWWFDRIREGRHGLFWEAHLRTRTFSPEAMSFMNLMFVADPAARASIGTLRAHPWLAGPACDAAALVADMTRRKAEVVEQRRAARAARDAERDAEAARGDVVPGAAIDARLVPLARTESAAKDDAPPPYPARATMTRYTNFYTAETAPSVMELLTQAFAKFEGETREVASEFKLRTTIKMPDGGGGVLDIVTRIYSTPSRLLLVELVRRGGPLVAFQDMYHEIVAVLAESVAAPPPPPPLEACA